MVGHMTNASDIIDALTVEAICERMGIKAGAVDKARKAGKLPSAWYAAACEMAGHDLPRHLFTFKGLDT